MIDRAAPQLQTLILEPLIQPLLQPFSDAMGEFGDLVCELCAHSFAARLSA